jgi:hypothetical protein
MRPNGKSELGGKEDETVTDSLDADETSRVKKGKVVPVLN